MSVHVLSAIYLVLFFLTRNKCFELKGFAVIESVFKQKSISHWLLFCKKRREGTENVREKSILTEVTRIRFTVVGEIEDFRGLTFKKKCCYSRVGPDVAHCACVCTKQRTVCVCVCVCLKEGERERPVCRAHLCAWFCFGKLVLETRRTNLNLEWPDYTFVLTSGWYI